MTEITAHRGFCQAAPENSLAAIEAAIDLGVEWIEIDLQLTADERVIIFHDKDLKRVGGQGQVVHQNWSELRGVDVRRLHPKPLSEPHLIPLLSDVLSMVAGRVRLNLELKYPTLETQPDSLVRAVLNEIAAHSAESYCVLTSFNWRVLETELSPSVPMGVAVDYPFDPSQHELPDVPIVSLNRKLVDKDFVRKVHQSGQSLHVWTVNDSAELQQLVEWGVDNIITDAPDLALRLRT